MNKIYQFMALIKVKLSRCSKVLIILLIQSLVLTSCSDGDQPSSEGLDETTGCTGSCVNASSFLTVEDVEQVISQGVFEAQSRGVSATIAVSDRVGNILGLYRMTDANIAGVTVTSNSATTTSVDGGLDGVVIPSAGDVTAAIAKAITGAYLSSEGNAFSLSLIHI